MMMEVGPVIIVHAYARHVLLCWYCVYLDVCSCMYCSYVHIHVHLHVYTCTSTCIYMYIYMYIHVRTYMNIL